jgi:hypothetical protein
MARRGHRVECPASSPHRGLLPGHQPGVGAADHAPMPDAEIPYYFRSKPMDISCNKCVRRKRYVALASDSVLSRSNGGWREPMDVDLLIVFLATKSLPVRPTWVERTQDYLTLTCPVDVHSVTLEGLRLRVTAMRSLPNENLTFQLEYHSRRGVGGPFCRTEWRPLKHHTNKNVGPAEFKPSNGAICRLLYRSTPTHLTSPVSLILSQRSSISAI